MHVNHWIEIDKEYRWYLDEKARVIKEKGMCMRVVCLVGFTASFGGLTLNLHICPVPGNTVVDSLPENDAACGELLMELADYLPKRYPTLFRREGLDTLVNVVYGETHTRLSERTGTDALYVISR